MIKYKLITPREFRLQGRTPEEAFVFLRVTDATVDAPIEYEGCTRLIDEIKLQLIGSYGERGRTLSEETSGYDLNNAMQNWIMAPFDPELVEGMEILRAG